MTEPSTPADHQRELVEAAAAAITEFSLWWARDHGHPVFTPDIATDYARHVVDEATLDAGADTPTITTRDVEQGAYDLARERYFELLAWRHADILIQTAEAIVAKLPPQPPKQRVECGDPYCDGCPEPGATAAQIVASTKLLLAGGGRPTRPHDAQIAITRATHAIREALIPDKILF